MRRTAKWIALVALGVAVAIVLLATFAFFSKGWSTEAAFRKVKAGMTQAEVHDLVGETEIIRSGGSFHWATTYQTQPRLWSRRHEWLNVEFVLEPAGDARAKHVSIQDLGPDDRSFWERIQDEYEYHRYHTRKLGW
jgi:hypothetical protein